MSRSVLLGFLSGKPRWCIWSRERIFPSLILKIRGKRVKVAGVVAAQLPVAYFKTQRRLPWIVEVFSARPAGWAMVSKVFCWCIIVSGWAREQCSKKAWEKTEEGRKKRSPAPTRWIVDRDGSSVAMDHRSRACRFGRDAPEAARKNRLSPPSQANESSRVHLGENFLNKGSDRRDALTSARDRRCG